MAEEERNRAKAELLKHEEELDRAQREHDTMKAKLIALERKIIVGGENLLEKAEEQVRKSASKSRGFEKLTVYLSQFLSTYLFGKFLI